MIKFLTPFIIIIAGVLIGGAIFLAKEIKTNAPKEVKNIVPKVSVVTPVNESDHILGNPQANIVVVEYGDTECPASKLFHIVMHQAMDNYGKTGQVAWVFRHFPLVGLHTKSFKEAEATECAALQCGNDMFWKYTDKIFATTPSNDELDPTKLPQIAKSLGLDVAKFNNCLASSTTKSIVDQNLADALKIAGGQLTTPHLEFVLKDALTDEKIPDIASNFGDNVVIGKDKKHISFSGSYTYDAFKVLIEIILK